MRDLQFFEHRLGLGGVRPQVLSDINQLHREIPVTPVLVICHPHTQTMWEMEVQRFGVQRVEVVSFVKARQFEPDVLSKIEQNPTILILDEPRGWMTRKTTREAIAPLITAAEKVFILN